MEQQASNIRGKDKAGYFREVANRANRRLFLFSSYIRDYVSLEIT